MQLESIEIVADRSAEGRCDQGFLRLRRLILRNRYADGGSSAEYPCDVVSRRSTDAVVAVLWERAPDGRVNVLLRRSPRAPVYLRRFEDLVHPDPRVYTSIDEVVAGLVEREDGPGPAGLARCAAREAEEEAGLALAPESFARLGGETFASPGTTDEKIFFTAAEARLADARPGDGDGSVMEECAELVVMELGEAIRACRSGAIPDMKTEVALVRLADRLGVARGDGGGA